MNIFENPAFDGHEMVKFCCDEETGLRAIIAVHSTHRGPACGGLRMWPYVDEAEALRDVLRLSRGMSYKNALAGLPLGGGKAVIIGDPRKDKSSELFRAFGRFVDRLGGVYITAEDVGTCVADLHAVAETTRHVTGLKAGPAASGDPSPYTALGVFLAIQAAVERRFGTSLLARRRILVQGLGNVGFDLCRQLHEAGATLLVADIDDARVRRAVQRFGAIPVGATDLFDQDCDVFAPCALGGILTKDTILQLRASIVMGAANNQLLDDEAGAALFERGCLYGPDYVTNAGGIINAGAEIAGLYDEAAVRARIGKIPETLNAIFDRSARQRIPANLVADAMAVERICRRSNRSDVAQLGISAGAC